MAHVPWHREVCAYCEVICEQLNKRGVSQVKYSIATEHEHSCCVLIAREDKFKINNEWCTWIDYFKYDQLIQDYYSSNGKKTFISSDYIAKTPEWALYKSKEHGFDPIEQRYRKTKAGKLVEIEYKSTESGCG